mgnify:CR=1 FL=1
MDGTSLTPEQEKLNALKQVLPEVFAEGKVDWKKLKATLGEDINFSNERYVLNWAGKSEAFKVLQAPTTKTLVPAKDESVNFDDTEHIFIEGENLEVLKVLQKSYFGKVKMIYIDPPYNTGNDSFIYPDKFSETKSDYEKRVGDKDEDGYMTKDGMFKKNSKENGQYHSNWLNMMMPRLYLAKNLLKQDGVIFISIDDNEVHNLRLLMNEIFGEENFVGETIKVSNSAKNNVNQISITHEYCLVYSKNKFSLSKGWSVPKINYKEFESYANRLLKEGLSSNEIEKELKALTKYPRFYEFDHFYYCDENGVYQTDNPGGVSSGNYDSEIIHPITKINCKKPQGGWRYKEVTIRKYESENRWHFGEDENTIPRIKRYLKECLFSKPTGVHFFDSQSDAKKLKSQNLPFDFPKPVEYIKYLLTMEGSESGLILDFFSGSGTTADAIMAINTEDGGSRRCISVQLPEQCDEKSEAYKVGYKTIADIAKERIRKVGIKLQEGINAEIKKIESEIEKLQGEFPTEETVEKISNLKYQISNLQNQDLGFKVLKLSDSNFKQWQQITGKDKQALEEQMKLFVDPVAKNATTENMVYELLLKSGKDLNSTIEVKDGFYAINETELILVLENANQEIINEVIDCKPQKVIALDRLFKGNDQLKTNASLQMKDAGIEFKTI